MKTKPSPARGRPRQFDRSKALAAAMRLFWERGYEAATLADLVAAMGINPPSLYAAFGDKRRLYCEAIEHYRATVAGFVPEELARGGTARDAVAGLLGRAAEIYCRPGDPGGCLVLDARPPDLLADDEARRSVMAARSALRQAVVARIEEGRRRGDIPQTSDAYGMGLFYAAVLRSMSALARDGATRCDLETVADQAMRAWPAGPA